MIFRCIGHRNVLSVHCFHSSVIANDAAMDVRVQIYFCGTDLISFAICSEDELLSHRAVLFLFF